MMILESEPLKRCCCGKYKLTETFISNNKMHELLGPAGNFCGSVDSHVIRDLQIRIKNLEAELQENQDVFTSVKLQLTNIIFTELRRKRADKIGTSQKKDRE